MAIVLFVCVLLQRGKHLNSRKAKVWVESQDLFSVLFWLPLPNAYIWYWLFFYILIL